MHYMGLPVGLLGAGECSWPAMCVEPVDVAMRRSGGGWQAGHARAVRERALISAAANGKQNEAQIYDRVILGCQPRTEPDSPDKLTLSRKLFMLTKLLP